MAMADLDDAERLKAATKTVVNDTGRFGTILTIDSRVDLRGTCL
jgi:hypothetical protein